MSYTNYNTNYDAVATDAGLRAHMLKVYNYMAGGLAFSALTAYLVANTSLNQYFYAFDNTGRIHATGLMLVCMFAPLALILALSFAQIKNWSTQTLTVIYWAFTGLFGISLSGLLLNQHADIIHPFLVTVISFAGLSIVGYTTKRNLSRLGSFCTMGLFGLLGMSLFALIFGMQINTMIFSVIGIIVFGGFTAYDTQRIKNDYLQTRDDSLGAALTSALSLYLDAINLFVNIYNVFNGRN